MQEFCKNIDMDSVYQEYASLVYRFLYSYTQDAEWSQELIVVRQIIQTKSKQLILT